MRDVAAAKLPVSNPGGPAHSPGNQAKRGRSPGIDPTPAARRLWRSAAAAARVTNVPGRFPCRGTCAFSRSRSRRRGASPSTMTMNTRSNEFVRWTERSRSRIPCSSRECSLAHAMGPAGYALPSKCVFRCDRNGDFRRRATPRCRAEPRPREAAPNRPSALQDPMQPWHIACFILPVGGARLSMWERENPPPKPSGKTAAARGGDICCGQEAHGGGARVGDSRLDKK